MFSGLASDPVARQTAVECLERLSTTLNAHARSTPEVDGGS
jgi:hypothetical protein